MNIIINDGSCAYEYEFKSKDKDQWSIDAVHRLLCAGMRIEQTKGELVWPMSLDDDTSRRIYYFKHKNEEK